MVQETPDVYEKVVKPYINGFPASRTQWVVDILSGKSEVDKVLHKDDSLTFGYIILPDMKWDEAEVANLYLVAITRNSEIRSLRDLRREHLPMLHSIRREASRVAKEKWEMGEGSLRFYVHYQPSYYHFHVHIVNVNYIGLTGMHAGQAHLLEDIISLLELSPSDGPSILAQMNFTYSLGEQHGLFASMRAAQQL